ncbi:alpha-ketoacid dehydrogenase subunit beta [Microbispora cellulosiformans]|uniref:Pyruvate dehydrogenase E1 component subunit beta n=1 Tax=Microbispora cellulosiformans TaxID=2614688 RepID=A0A5J5JTB1_9ACTN|nr:transketolase C-terminal domain-containing protein [Microbispora cellulosiformans]KAA9373306.1 alpha-ketoacid dehydrogenase subunit beta [Microbispora cellulosiformans]
MRLAEQLNRALHSLLEDPHVYLLGEDIADPYGGAFKVTKGLSTRFGERVVTTPISESAIVGAATGLALAGDVAIVEVMFADFVALAFDQLVNFAGKSVSMYGHRVPLRLVVRCPTGGGRGYGATHSQSLQKHFIGVPGLSIYEMSPFHDVEAVFREMIDRAEPALFFEDKILYTRQSFSGGVVDELFRYDHDPAGNARVFVDRPGDADCALIAPGGVAHRALDAMRTLLLEHDIACTLVVPARLYPLDADALLSAVGDATTVFVAEESTAGGTWGAEIANLLHRRAWNSLRRPVVTIHSDDSVIPSAAHLEERMLISGRRIELAVMEALRE